MYDHFIISMYTGYYFFTVFDEHCFAMYRPLLRQFRLSVRPSRNVSRLNPAQTPIATAVINGLFESLFHLVLGKLSLVVGGHP